MTTVKLQYWPVLTREQTEDGKLKRGGYKRTAAALQEREESLVRLETRTRALLTWGSANAVEFSLNTGRCIGNPDWVMTKESRKALRKLAREQFPKAAVDEDDGEDAVQKALAEPVLDKLQVDVGDFAAHDDAPPLPEAYVDKLNEEGNGAA
jgi:hypothetical protein